MVNASQLTEKVFHSPYIFLGVDTDRVVGRFRDMDGNTVFKKAELL